MQNFRVGMRQIIITESEKLSGRRPEYRLLDDAELLLTIYAAKSPHGED